MEDKKLYELTEEQKSQLPAWAARWEANALKCGQYSDADKRACTVAIEGLYKVASMEFPKIGIFCRSPISAAIAAGVAVGVWYLRRSPKETIDTFSRLPTETELHTAVVQTVTQLTINGYRRLLGDETADASLPLAESLSVALRASFPEGSVIDAGKTKKLSRKMVASLVEYLIKASANTAGLRNGGNQWSSWVSYVSFFRHVVKHPADYTAWSFYEDAAAFGPRFVYLDFWIVSEYPEYLRHDEQGRPHHPTEAFCRYSDGWELYYWHGTQVPKNWITSPRSVEASLALTWPNVEQRRALAEIIGWEKVISEVNTKIIDTDPDPEIGVLIEADIPGSPAARFLKVLCATKRTFCLPVPREMTTALQANAWTFGLEPISFKPEVRT